MFFILLFFLAILPFAAGYLYSRYVDLKTREKK